MDSDSRTPLIQRSNSGLKENNYFNRIFKPCAVEFLSTAIFVFAGTTSVQSENGLLIALVHGMTIALLVHCFADISGAHINPAVTVAVFIGNGTPRLLLALGYIVSQLTGSLVGAALNRAVLWFPVDTRLGINTTMYEFIAGGAHELRPGMNPGQGVLLEVILTFLLCQTVLHVAVDRKVPEAAMAIGLTVFVDIAIGENLTGASMNPARSFGPAVIISDLTHEPWKNHYIYWIGPLTGAVLAALVYRFLLSRRKTHFLRRQSPGVLNNDVQPNNSG